MFKTAQAAFEIVLPSGKEGEVLNSLLGALVDTRIEVVIIGEEKRISHFHLFSGIDHSSNNGSTLLLQVKQITKAT